MIARLENINEWSVHPHKKKTVWHLLILDTEYLQIVCDPCRGQGRPGGGTEEGGTLQLLTFMTVTNMHKNVLNPKPDNLPPTFKKIGLVKTFW